jgi:hypothetical protein
MRFIKSLTVIFWIAISFSPTTAQIHWKEVKTVEDFYEAYPERLIFMFDQINLDRKGLESVKQYHDKQNYVAASIALLDYYKKSKTVKKYRKSQPPINSSKIAAADTILSNIFEVQNVKGKIPILKDGHRAWGYKGPNNDLEWAWLSNRHSQLYTVFKAYMVTGNPIYAEYADEFLRDFIINSWPYPNSKTNSKGLVWRGLEVSFRAKKWSEIFYTSLGIEYFNPATQLMILASLPEHAHYNRHFHSKKGNWLTMEISALTSVAAYFPEYKKSSQWINYSIDQMLASMKKQIYPDGVQTELASHYHNVSLQNFELFYAICKEVGKTLPQEYEKTLIKMFDYTAKNMRPDGSRVLNNDSDRGNGTDNNRAIILNALKKFDRPEWKYIATNGKSGSKPLQPSFFYPWAGQLISRSGFDTQAHWSFFDVGPWGTGHQHQDKLHLSVTAFGTDFLVDSGRFAYRGSVADQYRSYARSSAAHNLVLIDDKNQNPGPTEVKNALDNTHFKIHKDYDYAYGDFNDFENLSGSAQHTRAVFYLRNGFWLVADKIKTDRPRALKFLWHWHPDVKIIQGKKNIKGLHKNGTLSLTALSDQIFKISEIKGLLEPSVQGWYSPEYNIYAPNSVTEFSTNIDQEQHFLWLIVPESEDSSALSMDKIKTHEDHFKIEFTFNGQKKKLVLPFKDATKVDLN